MYYIFRSCGEILHFCRIQPQLYFVLDALTCEWKCKCCVFSVAFKPKLCEIWGWIFWVNNQMILNSLYYISEHNTVTPRIITLYNYSTGDLKNCYWNRIQHSLFTVYTQWCFLSHPSNCTRSNYLFKWFRNNNKWCHKKKCQS